jgi:hypothetical protein
VGHDHSVPASAPRHPQNAARITLFATVALLVAYFIDTTFFARNEIRIDSGDLRKAGLLFTSIPSRLPSLQRSRLLEASDTLRIPAVWCRVVHSAPSNGDIGGRAFLYCRTADLLHQEPGLGQIVLSQVADYFQHPKSESRYPSAAALLHDLEWNEHTRERVFDEERLKEDRWFWITLNLLDYTPRPGGTLAALQQQLPPTSDGSAIVIADSITSRGGSKYKWHHARVLRIIDCDQRFLIDTEIDFARLDCIPDLHDGRYVLYLDHRDGPPGWWQLTHVDPR